MKITNKRYAYITADTAPQYPLEETIVFIVAGTEGVALDDLRLRDVGGQDCLVSSIAGPLFDIPALPCTQVSKKRINPTTGAVETVMINGPAMKNVDYYNSPYWNPLSITVDPKYTLIDEDTYWNMRSAHYTAHHVT